MAEGTKLADAYVQIIPVASGISGKLRELFKDLPEEGNRTGKSVGGSLGNSIKNALIATGLTTAIGKIIKDSFSEGAALEQSLGGVETLFKKHADIVKKNAEKAYRTAGLSANEYMENVTSFSASLLSSLSGDTQKAAEVADMAMVDMSDNANKFGSDMQDIQNAYQGFAKQNYTMLDNLKLGYGGTKSEMERLLQDAQKLSGVEYNIDNLSDVYNAIHTIQQNLDITGTTAKEASSTFSGSFGSMKAAAKNFLGTLTAGGDAGEAFDSLTKTAGTFFGNVKRMLGTMGKQIDELFYSVAENFGITKAGADGIKVALEALTTAALGFAAVSKFVKMNEELATMGIKTAIITAKNKALNGVLAAQASLALKASAAMAAAVAAGELIGWLITDVWDPAGVNETADSFESLSASTNDLKERTEELADIINKTHDDISKANDDTKTQSDNYKTLRNRLFELNEAEKKSTTEKAEMQSIVEQLNKDIPGLNLALDSQTGSLKNNKNIVTKMTDAYAKMSESKDLQDKLAEATRNAKDAEEAYAEAQKKRNEAISEGIDRNSDEMLALDTAFLKMHRANEQAKEDLQNIKDTIAAATQAEQDFANGFGDTSQYIANLSDDTLSSVNEICSSYADAYQTQHDLIFGQMDLLDEFCGKSDITASKLEENLQSNIDGFNDWETDLSTLKERVKNGVIPQEFYDKLAEMGPKGAGYVKAFAGMTDTELKNYYKNSAEIYDKMNDYVDDSMKKMKDTAAKQLDNLIDLPGNKKDDMKEAYIMLGNYAAEGYAEGIKKGSDNMNDAVRQAIQDAIDTAASTQKSHSPSKIFANLGGYASEGYALGIEKNAALAAKASVNMVKDAINSANKTNDRMSISALNVGSSNTSKPYTAMDAQGAKLAFLEALVDYSNTNGRNKNCQPINVNVQIDRRTVGSASVDYINETTRLNGKSPLIQGVW